MSNEDPILNEMIKHFEEASLRIQASRYIMQEHALVKDPKYLRLVARLSEALDVTEAARREARRLRDYDSLAERRFDGVPGRSARSRLSVA